MSVFRFDLDDLDDQHQLADAYEAAMDRMREPGPDGKMPWPIVPHPTLHKPETLFYSIQGRSVVDSPPPLSTDEQRLADQILAARKYTLPPLNQDDEPPATVSEEIGRFKMFLVDQLCQRVGADAPLCKRVLQADLLVFPIRRRASNVLEDAEQDEIETSGAVFLLVEPPAATPNAQSRPALRIGGPTPPNDPAPLNRLALGMSWLLEKASAAEAWPIADVQKQLDVFYGNVIHGTASLVRAIKTQDIFNILSRYNWKQVSDERGLLTRLVDPKTSEPDTDRALRLVKALRRSIMAEDTAAAMLSLIEFRFKDGVLREKVQSKSPYELLPLVEEAASLSNHVTGIAQETIGPSTQEEELPAIDLYISPESRMLLSRVSMPEGYLDARIIRGILFEFLRNAQSYGVRIGSPPSVQLVVEARRIEHRVRVTLTNDMSPEQEPIFRSSAGFVDRTRTLLAPFGDDLLIEPSFPSLHGHPQYAVSLTLGALSRRADKKTMEVRPIFR